MSFNNNSQDEGSEYSSPSFENGDGCSQFYWDFSKFTDGKPNGIVNIIANYFRLFPPTYSIDRIGSYSK